MILGNAEKNMLGIPKNDGKKYNYAFIKNLEDMKESSQFKVANLVENGSIVLDLGCGNGLIGKYLHDKKDCTVYGADLSTKLVNYVKKQGGFEDVVQLDFETVTKLPFNYHFFDYIILADVLEHLKNPENLLKVVKQYLRPNGKIIISLPNVGHKNIIFNLLNGHFNYGELGLLDNTHIRFFTDKSFFDFLNNINKEDSDYYYEGKIVDTVVDLDSDSNLYQNLYNYVYIENMDVLQYIIVLTLSKERVINKIEYENSFNEKFNLKLNEINNSQLDYESKIKELENEIVSINESYNQLELRTNEINDSLSECKAMNAKFEEENLQKSKMLDKTLEDYNNIYNENEKLVKENNFLYELLDYYKQENTNQKEQILNVREENNFLVNNNVSLKDDINNINEKYNHKLYKLTSFILKIIYAIIPYKSIRYKAVISIKKNIKSILKLIRYIVKHFIKLLLPKPIRRKIKNIVYNSRKLSRLCGYPYNPNLPVSTLVIDKVGYGLSNLTFTDKKIAVHLHLYYVDLANEFYNYFKNIPYKFDLYISVPNKKYEKPIKRKFKKITNVDKVVVKESKNLGRDYGPMFVLFSNELKKYDYILHLHSKKSVRMGNEQKEWRIHMVDSLLGTRETVMQIFNLLINYNVGICYPTMYKDLPYWCATYLGAGGIAKDFYKKVDLKYEDTYLNFSAGSFFWCDVKLLKDIFDLNLSWSDFDDKGKNIESTLAYVMERIYDPLLKKYKMNFAVHNQYNGYYYLNRPSLNIEAYYNKSINNDINMLLQYDIISFDIFDTLVTRGIYTPDDIFKVIDKKINGKYKIKDGKYYELRKKAELNVRKRKNFIGDCTINEIYEEFQNLAKITKKESLEIMQLEIETDTDFIFPRKESLELYNRILSNNREIVLLSDMYYTKNILTKILHKCGYKGWYDLIVSSEYGIRKDNGTAWDYMQKKYHKFIHIGDNEESDIHLPVLRNIPIYHLMMGRKMYKISNYYNEFKNNLENSIMVGLVVNKSLLNSPYAFNNTKDGSVLLDLKGFGYSILGPIFLYYINWLNKINKYNKLLFVAREGYYLQKIYKHIIRLSKKYKGIDKTCYYLISRRAITNVNIKSFKDIEHILKEYYVGNLKELFYYRFGIIIDEKHKNPIVNTSNSNDFEKIIAIAKDYEIQIIDQAQRDYNAYMEYANSVINSKKDKLLMVDLGYSGTAQFELSKLLNTKIDGAYFVVSTRIKPFALDEKVYSCFNSTNYGLFDPANPIWKNQLVLEAFLTSPNGQFIRFDEKNNPIYLGEYGKDALMKKLDKIYEGIIEFIDDMARLNVKDICDLDLDEAWIMNNFGKYLENTSVFSPELIDTLQVEDFYCSGKIIKIKNN